MLNWHSVSYWPYLRKSCAVAKVTHQEGWNSDLGLGIGCLIERNRFIETETNLGPRVINWSADYYILNYFFANYFVLWVNIWNKIFGFCLNLSAPVLWTCVVRVSITASETQRPWSVCGHQWDHFHCSASCYALSSIAAVWRVYSWFMGTITVMRHYPFPLFEQSWKVAIYVQNGILLHLWLGSHFHYATRSYTLSSIAAVWRACHWPTNTMTTTFFYPLPVCRQCWKFPIC